MEKHRWHVRVLSSAGGRAVAYARRRHFEIGAPVQFDEEYDAITALEYVLGAIGADLVNGLQALAAKRRIPVDEIEAAVSAQLNNPLMYLGVIGEQGHPGIEKIAIRVYVNSPADEAEVRLLWDEVLIRSPLVWTFGKSLQLELDFQLAT
jgi:hypothetical protein